MEAEKSPLLSAATNNKQKTTCLSSNDIYKQENKLVTYGLQANYTDGGTATPGDVISKFCR
jgi:hypothetical protein